jgi:ABC-type phosphate transport system auxiliary subunit
MDKLRELMKEQLGENFTDEVESQIEEAFEADAQSRVDEETKGLKRKRDQLLKENRNLKDGKADDNSEELQERIEELEKQNKEIAKERDKLQKSYEKETSQLQEQLQSEQGAVQRMLVDNGISAELDKVNVLPQYKRAAQKLLRDQVQVVEENGERKAVATVDNDGTQETVPLEKFVASWAQSDEGKAFVRTAGNSGGGASGSGGVDSSVKEMTKSEFNQLKPKDQAAFMQNGGQLKEDE